jgi:adenylate cyclase
MRDAAQQFNERLAGNRLMTRFGVDWGRVSLSTVGAHGHYEYRAVGDAVNTATRIQELNKALGTRILLSEAALGDAGSPFLLRDLGRYLLRGKNQPVRVFELFDSRARAMPWEHELCARFEEACRALADGASATARSRLEALREAFPDDGPTAFLLKSLDDETARRDGAWIIN